MNGSPIKFRYKISVSAQISGERARELSRAYYIHFPSFCKSLQVGDLGHNECGQLQRISIEELEHFGKYFRDWTDIQPYLRVAYGTRKYRPERSYKFLVRKNVLIGSPLGPGGSFP